MTIHSPKVSVILTSYNHAKYLRESIESVLNQTYTDFELIIWDDASVDDSWKIISSYSDPRIRSFREITNDLIRNFRRAILEEARGEYIAIHHSDDIWAPEKLEKQVNFLNENFGIGAVFSWARIIDEEGQPFLDKDHYYMRVFEQPNRTRHEWLNYFFYYGNVLCHPSVLIRKSCYETVGVYRNGLFQLPDFDMWVRLCFQYEIHILPERLISFRVRASEANSSANNFENRSRVLFEFLQVYENYLRIKNSKEFIRIFPGAVIYFDVETDGCIEYALARLSLEASLLSLKLLGAKTLFDLLNDPIRMKFIEGQYGFTGKDFVDLMAKNDLFSLNELTDLRRVTFEQKELIFEQKELIFEQKELIKEHEQEKEFLQRQIFALKKRILAFDSTFSGRLERFRKKLASLLKHKRTKKYLDLIRTSSYFDEEWYIQKNPDLKGQGLQPVEHFLFYGGNEGRNPGPYFQSLWYLLTYPDVDDSNLNPLLHYIMYGKKEGRLPNPSGLLVGEDAQTTQDPELLSREEENLFARIREHGGLSGIVSKAMWTLRRRGFGSLVEQIRKELTRGKVATSKLEPEMAFALEYRVVPYYLKHYFAAPKTSPENSPRIAIHLHLENPDQAQDFGKYLANVPVPFTLFVSIPDGEEQVTHWVQTTLPMVKEMRVTITPTHARKLVPFVVEFDKKLSQYDVVAHLHKFDEDFDEVMSNLFGAAEIIHQILQLLQQDACFVYSSQKGNKLDHGQVWDDIHPTIQKLAEKYWKQFPEKDARVEFPQGGVFWAKSIALEKFLALPVKYESFSEEAYVDLEKLLLVSAKGQPGRNYRLHSPHTDSVSPAYENENDYSDRIVHNSVKVLSYYLPQFYPIPENDEWHGNGFTEWNKVRNTTPLFYGHDQQRAPHDDIGYYSLITTDVLRQQSQWMKQVGVAGQIFYHYWFTGKLILEKPAQMLLADLGIDMPFCFCWANENWTRRWDGNEREILLKQDYSAEDAASFINYLIPFFRDKRYITIEGRPVLFIYRPSSIPDYALYKRIWNDLCAQNGLPNPYVVAILTRGAASPVEFDMDAGCERVLHDWTDNAVPNIKDDLHKYWDLNGSVLDYNAVADYYMAQPPLEDFTYFRSLIPTWDNSPRYGSDAYLIHNSTPGKFQQWLEHLVQDAETRLPYDRRFVIVNAWNEWAESAILDPDKKHGYAYLNSIGRALSDIPYEGREYLHQQIPRDVTISLSLSERAFDTLQNDPEQRRKFFACLAQSSLFEKCRLMFAQPQVAEWFEEMYPASNIEKEAKDGGQFEIHLKQVCYFSPAALEPMLQMALCYNAGMVIPTVLNDAAFTHAGLSTNWEWNGSVDDLPLILLNKNGNNLVKCCVDAGVFITLPSSNSNAISEPVSTIIRFHRSGDMKLLQNALYSLLAQTDCVVQPVLAVQDLPEPMLAELQTMLEKIPFHNKYAPKVKRYQSDASCSDLRSLMLNQELKLVRTQFASFLDYDDILFAGAFSWLITRLKKTGKNASFGLIYSTSVTWEENRINKRSAVYNYGKSYKDFYNNNHTPIHGFMLDVTRINLLDLEYVRCMKYMEDYYLTLQIFTENDTDWNSLQEGKFIGDYYHYEDKVQTLANIDQDQRIKLISLPEYAKCEENIQLLRQKKRRYNR